MKRINTSILLVLILTLLSTPFTTLHQVRASDSLPPFNLDLDVNGDGIPDELADAVATIENRFTLAQSDGVLSSDEMNSMEQDLVVFDSRLPYTSETRSLQQQVADLNAQIADATPEQAAAINTEIVQLSERMLADPGYARTLEALTKLLAPDLSAAFATRHQIYLPFVIGGADSSAGLADSANPSDVQTARSRPRVSWGGLRRGDIMFVNSGNKVNNFLYALEFNHVGTFDGNGWVYESNPEDGANMRRLVTWQANNLYIGLGRNNQRSQQQVEQALNWAKQQYGTDGRTRYNWFFPNKWTDNALYCSQLVWKIHSRLQTDLDSNHWTYTVWFVARWGGIAVRIWRNPIPGIIGSVTASAIVIAMVAPDEIARSGRVSIYSKGWTN